MKGRFKYGVWLELLEEDANGKPLTKLVLQWDQDTFLEYLRPLLASGLTIDMAFSDLRRRMVKEMRRR